MVVEVFRTEACTMDFDEGTESFGDVFNLGQQWVHRNSDGGGGAILEMVEAAEECQKRQRLHETHRAMALILC